MGDSVYGDDWRLNRSDVCLLPMRAAQCFARILVLSLTTA
jgi:hypothetical protein